MFRAVANAALSALMVMTLLWGGCVACPQFFAFPGAKKDCCKAGQCERSKSQKTESGAQCKRMPLEPGAFCHFSIELPVVAIQPADLLRAAAAHPADVVPAGAVEHPPPDLQVLNATFLI